MSAGVEAGKMPKQNCSRESAMAMIKVRYLVARQRKNRPIRYYWIPTKKLQDAGFMPRRLPDEIAAATAAAERLNAKVDQFYAGTLPTQSAPADGTLAALDALFQTDDTFRDGMKPRTQRDYLYSIKPALTWAGESQVPDITRKVIKAWYRDLRDRKGAANARNSAAALRRLLAFGRDEGWIKDNPALELKIAAPASRDRVWTIEERNTFCAASVAAGRPSMALAVMLGWCLGQRPADLRTLPSAAYDGARVFIRQAKTDAHIAVPALPELRALLNTTPRRSTQMVVSEVTGRPYQESDFQHTFAEIRDSAGLKKDLQFRDLRRTLATALGAAGCTDDQIRGVTGHKTRSVVAVYVRPDSTFADGAMKRLQRASRRGKS